MVVVFVMIALNYWSENYYLFLTKIMVGPV